MRKPAELSDEQNAARLKYLLELDGGEIYALLGDYDGIHHEWAITRIDAAMAAQSEVSTRPVNE